jgi:hypothetical protein
MKLKDYILEYVSSGRGAKISASPLNDLKPITKYNRFMDCLNRLEGIDVICLDGKCSSYQECADLIKEIKDDNLYYCVYSESGITFVSIFDQIHSEMWDIRFASRKANIMDCIERVSLNKYGRQYDIEAVYTSSNLEKGLDRVKSMIQELIDKR